MVGVAITGGGEALRALSDGEVTPPTHRESDELGSGVVDVTDYDRNALADAFAGRDVLVHSRRTPRPPPSGTPSGA